MGEFSTTKNYFAAAVVVVFARWGEGSLRIIKIQKRGSDTTEWKSLVCNGGYQAWQKEAKGKQLFTREKASRSTVRDKITKA
jgi:hypothetical protein